MSKRKINNTKIESSSCVTKNNEDEIIEIDITLPDDFHHHFRDGTSLYDTVYHAVKRFGRCIAMPNIIPPVRTKTDALAYKKRIISAYYDILKIPAHQQPGLSSGELKIQESTSIYNDYTKFEPLMTLYLTNTTKPSDIKEAKDGGILACKLYPAGATTNSDDGVTDLSLMDAVFEEMANVGMILLVHTEVLLVNNVQVDIFDREKYGIELMLDPIIKKHTALKVVMEHITTADGVEFVKSCGPNVAATITAHHLLYNRNDMLSGNIKPHLYCLPILKSETNRLALIEAATSGNPKFFLGTDSAPHPVHIKESACGCAGAFTAHAAVELYAEVFDNVGKIEMLEGFASLFGSAFYGLQPNKHKIKLKKCVNRVVAGAGAEENKAEGQQKAVDQGGIKIPYSYRFGEFEVRPVRAGEDIKWCIAGVKYTSTEA